MVLPRMAPFESRRVTLPRMAPLPHELRPMVLPSSPEDGTYTEFIDIGCAVVPVEVRYILDYQPRFRAITKLTDLNDVHTRYKRAVYDNAQLPIVLVNIVWEYVDMFYLLPLVGSPGDDFESVTVRKSLALSISIYPAMAILSMLCCNAEIVQSKEPPAYVVSAAMTIRRCGVGSFNHCPTPSFMTDALRADDERSRVVLRVYDTSQCISKTDDATRELLRTRLFSQWFRRDNVVGPRAIRYV